jgi:hypothetical protein
MAAIPWATFAAPGNPSGVFEVNNDQMYVASVAAREHYNLYLEPEEVVPLAVALYNEDFRQFVARVWEEEDGPTVGVILRSRRSSLIDPLVTLTGNKS